MVKYNENIVAPSETPCQQTLFCWVLFLYSFLREGGRKVKRKKTNKIKRVIALVLCFAMVLSGNMINVSAADLGENGLRGDYYLLNSGDLSYGEYKGTYIDANIASTDMEATIKERTGTANYVAVCWTGRIVAPADGDYIFHCYSDNGARLTIDNTVVIDQWQSTSYKQDWTSEAITMAEPECKIKSDTITISNVTKNDGIRTEGSSTIEANTIHISNIQSQGIRITNANTLKATTVIIDTTVAENGLWIANSSAQPTINITNLVLNGIGNKGVASSVAITNSNLNIGTLWYANFTNYKSDSVDAGCFGEVKNELPTT